MRHRARVRKKRRLQKTCGFRYCSNNWQRDWYVKSAQLFSDLFGQDWLVRQINRLIKDNEASVREAALQYAKVLHSDPSFTDLLVSHTVERIRQARQPQPDIVDATAYANLSAQVAVLEKQFTESFAIPRELLRDRTDRRRNLTAEGFPFAMPHDLDQI